MSLLINGLYPDCTNSKSLEVTIKKNCLNGNCKKRIEWRFAVNIYRHGETYEQPEPE